MVRCYFTSSSSGGNARGWDTCNLASSKNGQQFYVADLIYEAKNVTAAAAAAGSVLFV